MSRKMMGGIISVLSKSSCEATFESLFQRSHLFLIRNRIGEHSENGIAELMGRWGEVHGDGIVACRKVSTS
jgi:hypothetical protein